MVQAVEQGKCTWCGESEDNFTVTERTFYSLTDEEEGIERQLRCTCGAEGSVTITEDGLDVTGSISHTDASWNTDDSDESEDDEE